MTPEQAPPLRPWYREPWPWVLIAIPALTIAACGLTLWLAISHPDPVVVDADEYHRVQSGMRAGTQPPSAPPDPADDRDDG